MRVLHVAAANSTSGGGEKHVADCLRQMSTRGIDLGLVAPEGGDLKEIAQSLNVSYYPAPIEHGIAAPRTAIVRKAIDDFKPDIIHAHGHRAALFARRADYNAAQRVVYTFHGIHVDKGLLSPAKMLVERMLKSHTAAFIAVSQADLERALELGIAEPDKISVVNNGIPAPKAVVAGLFKSQHDIAPSEQMILSVGRISKQKNLSGLLRIFEKAGRIFENAEKVVPLLVMVCPGTPEEFAELQREVAMHAFASRIVLLPRQQDLSTAYHDADIFALASLWEGRPYVLAETLSYATPVVGYAINGNIETVANGKSGVLVPLGDEQAFGQAIYDLLTDDAMRKTYGEFGAQDMRKNYSIEAMIDRQLMIYQNVIDSRTLPMSD